MNHLRDPDAFAGDQVARAIGTIGDRSVSADLLNLLVTAPAAERTRAALALGMLKSEEAVPGLAALLSTGDPQAQRVAAEALAAIGTPAAIGTLVAPLADPQMTSARHAAMGGLETAGQPAVALLADGPARPERGGPRQRRGNARLAETSERRGGSGPIALRPESCGAGSGAWALGEVGTEPARLALIPASVAAANSAPILALNPAPIPVFKSTPILVQTAARPVALAPLAPAPLAPLAALPGALAEVLAEYWSPGNDGSAVGAPAAGDRADWEGAAAAENALWARLIRCDDPEMRGIAQQQTKGKEANDVCCCVYS